MYLPAHSQVTTPPFSSTYINETETSLRQLEKFSSLSYDGVAQPRAVTLLALGRSIGFELDNGQVVQAIADVSFEANEEFTAEKLEGST
ncbi:hypothetical protein PsorP6_007561 [Peronosclerospora sorghi]|uniref:Uncharacterized protein n=1 Tax=Peronosclerospora sorghi TaxID=230839 RepID=A0ACC0WDR2_9STRA|nr:hypothetical protein PsorP6_007561 [Peronosclerospora sorghi]